MKRLLVIAALLFVLPAHAEVTMEWVTVSDPGNACGTQSQGCFGAVAHTYQIGKYEVTSCAGLLACLELDEARGRLFDGGRGGA